MPISMRTQHRLRYTCIIYLNGEVEINDNGKGLHTAPHGYNLGLMTNEETRIYSIAVQQSA